MSQIETSVGSTHAAAEVGTLALLRSYFEQEPALWTRYKWLRRHASGIVGSNYDISDTCNLTCEGCLYFAGSDRLGHEQEQADAEWERLFAAEAARGVNFAYLAGAEPALRPSRLAAAARQIGRGVIFTNGTVRLNPRLPFAVHVSVWGNRTDSAAARGGDSYEKAFRIHGGQPRVRFVMTVNAQNAEGAWDVAQRCREAGSPLTFSIYSPTIDYRARLATAAVNDDPYFHMSSADRHLIPDAQRLLEIRALLCNVAERYPETVLYRSAYNRWVTDPAGLYDIDPVTGLAVDCGTRRTARHRHVRADLSASSSKCCSPNIDCAGCRAYTMAAGTAVSRFRRFATTLNGFRDWIDISEQWAELFLPGAPRD